MSAHAGCCSRRQVLRAAGLLAATAVLPGWLAGCGGSGDPQPPEIALDQDVCEWCRMTIDDPRLPAAFVPASGRALRFGEPGCLLAWLAEHRDAKGTAFVTAYDGGGWLRADSAVLSVGAVRTPMRFDLAAWRAEPPAEGSRRTWTDLLQRGAPDVRRD